MESVFKVQVTAVNTLRQKGKTKRFRGTIGRRSDVKKAVVTLAEGHSHRRDHGGLTDMALKTYNPVTPGRRQLVLVDKSELYKGKPVKALTEGLTRHGGRNNTGRITARRIGGGAKPQVPAGRLQAAQVRRARHH